MDPHPVQHDDSSATNDARPKITLNACIPCRKVKMKCWPSEDSSICLRCQRKQFTCFYENHRRGRKPGTKLRGRARSYDSAQVSIGRGHSHQAIVPASIGNSQLQALEDESAMAEHQGHSPALQPARVSQLVEESGVPAIPEKDKKVDGLSPFRLLNRHAMAGSFSVENVLEAESAGETDDRLPRAQQALSKNSNHKRSQDPVAMGLITLLSAMQLFDSFLKYMAPYIIHFDPALHTYDYIQRRSSLLLVTILSASAKIFNPNLHPRLHRHSEDLLGKAFTNGEKSVETIKAVLILTYWKEPDDKRVWQLVGYACRMCVELQGRRAQTRDDDVAPPAISSTKLRERRNVERLWLTLFVYDRSISLQLGKQWMLHIDDLTRRADTWHRHELAIRNGDAILSAFVELRVLSSDLLNVLDIDSSSSNQQQHEMLLNMFNADLEKWEKKWNEVFDQMSLEPCHQFLYRFYGLHTRLYINSIRLQVMLVHMTAVAKRSLWLSYTSALEMLQAIINILAPAQLLYYAQDSIHVMTAYAAVFLIKVLLSMPESLPLTAESAITEVITRASEAFGAQCASPTTGCAYQARFLRNVVTQYWSSKKSKRQEPAEQPAGTNEQPATHSAGSNTVHVQEELRESPGSHQPTYANDGWGFSVRPSMVCPYVENTSSDLGNQPFWHQNVMDPDVWEGLLMDGNFYPDELSMMTSPFEN